MAAPSRSRKEAGYGFRRERSGLSHFDDLDTKPQAPCVRPEFALLYRQRAPCWQSLIVHRRMKVIEVAQAAPFTPKTRTRVRHLRFTKQIMQVSSTAAASLIETPPAQSATHRVRFFGCEGARR